MKPTQVTELFANIRKTFVSFFSILMFVALGVGIFLGISWVAPALQNASDKVFDEGSFHHFQIQFPYGLTDDDLAQLAEVEGVTDVEPTRQSFQTLPVNGESATMKVQSLGERIDTLSVVEGELPAKAGEIALSAGAAAGYGLAVGDTITFESDASSGDSLGALANVEGQAQPTSDSDGMKFLNGATYKVVALVHSPEYLATASETYGYAPNVSGSIALLGWVPPSAFDASAFQNGYPVVNVRCDSLQGINSFAADYESRAVDIDKRITKLGSKLADARYSDLHSQAQEKVDEAEQQLAQGKEQIAAGEQQLVDGRAELEKQRSEGEAKLSAAYQQLTMLERVKNEIAQYLEKAKRFYDEVKGALDTIGDDGVIEIDGETYNAPQLLALLPHAKGAYETLQKEYDAKVIELNAAWNEYYAGQAELNRKVAEAEQKLADGQAQLDEAKKKVAEGEPQVESAKEQVASMKDYSWTVTGRMDNAGCVNVRVFSNVTTSLSFSMAALFVIVGLLVSYSAVSRIVHEQITQVGTKKALGLREREITTSFLMYAGLAVVFGAIVGAIVGVTAVEGIIANALSSMFILGSYPPFFGVGQFLVVTALELVLVLGATWLACRSILRKQAIDLLRGEEPPTAKTRFYEKWAVWSRLPLLTQTMINNCVNDKRRVFSTIVGVAGCTALIVTAITLNNDVLKSYDEHYANVYGFSHIAYVDGSVAGALDNVEKELQNEDASTAQVLRKWGLLKQENGERDAARITVPADEADFEEIYHVRPIAGPYFNTVSQGVWVSQAFAEHHGAKVGDIIDLDLGDGVSHKMPIVGFYGFHLTFHEVIMSRGCYEREFGTSLTPNAVLASATSVSLDEVAGKLSAIDGFDSIVDDKVDQSGNFTRFASVSSAVVLIYLALAALMAVVVLLNLNVMFIEEKKRELIVLMINGFSVRDAKRYIYNDTFVLTVLGIVCGVMLGCAMGSVTVGSIEPETASFVKGVDWIAVAAGVVGSAVLAFIMSVIALRRIPRFALTDINKF